MVLFFILILWVYQIPDLAVSSKVLLSTFISLQYHKGYFHLKIESLIFIFLLSFKGDSPSQKTELITSKSLLLNNALSPLSNSWLIIFTKLHPFLAEHIENRRFLNIHLLFYNIPNISSIDSLISWVNSKSSKI